VTRAITLTRAGLERLPLPRPDANGDKDRRGAVLVVGGSKHVPGAVLLASVAALRAGAGKLQLASVASAAMALGVAVPESLVIALPESRSGEISATNAMNALDEHVGDADAVLLGPGMLGTLAVRTLVRGIVRRLAHDATLVLDAEAIQALRNDESVLHRLSGRAVLTPHAGEMASLLGVDKSDVEADASSAARLAAERFGAVVVLKGAESWIAIPGGPLYHFSGGCVGLATSGSGDVLAGVVTGLAARGASAERAVLWAVHLHGRAGRALQRRVGRIGFLARELLDEIPSGLTSAR